MFLSLRKTVIVIGWFSPIISLAGVPHLQEGQYRRNSGSADLCLEFSLTQAVIEAEEIEFGPHYSFKTKDDTQTTKSSLQADCEFHETSRRTNGKDRTILERTNKKVCGQITKSDITTRITIQPGRLKLDVEDKTPPESDGDDKSPTTYSCVWTRAPATKKK